MMAFTNIPAFLEEWAFHELSLRRASHGGELLSNNDNLDLRRPSHGGGLLSTFITFLSCGLNFGSVFGVIILRGSLFPSAVICLLAPVRIPLSALSLLERPVGARSIKVALSCKLGR